MLLNNNLQTILLFNNFRFSGKIYVASTGIDRETTASHTLTISAYSSTLSASKITGTITITVTDDNDITPAFTQVNLEFNIFLF